MKFIFLFLFFFVLVTATHGANILVVLFKTFSKSHYIFVLPLLKSLSESGHNVTVVTFKGMGIKEPLYHEIIPELPVKYTEFFEGKI